VIIDQQDLNSSMDGKSVLNEIAQASRQFFEDNGAKLFSKSIRQAQSRNKASKKVTPLNTIPHDPHTSRDLTSRELTSR
jgi:hypothetical protein